MFRSLVTKAEKIGQKIPWRREPLPSNSNSRQSELQLPGQQLQPQLGQQQQPGPPPPLKRQQPPLQQQEKSRNLFLF